MRTDENATWALWASSFGKLEKHFGTDHYYSKQQKVWGWWFCSHIILISITRTSYWVCKLMYLQKTRSWSAKKLRPRLLKSCLWMQKGVVVFVGIFVRICNKYLPLTFESMLCKCQRLKWPIKKRPFSLCEYLLFVCLLVLLLVMDNYKDRKH